MPLKTGALFVNCNQMLGRVRSHMELRLLTHLRKRHDSRNNIYLEKIQKNLCRDYLLLQPKLSLLPPEPKAASLYL